MRLVFIGLLCSAALAPQTQVDWVTQMKNAPIYDVRAYGAKGDGVANDTAAIQKTMAAVELAGGGSVFFPKGTFRYVDPARSYGAAGTKYFTNEGSNVTIFGTGDSSVIQLEGPIGQGMTFAYIRAGWNVMCSRMDNYPASCNTTANPPEAPWPQLQQFQPATAGSRTITLVNSSAGSLFTPGMDLRLQSGQNVGSQALPPQHFEYNQVQSVSGGVITLASPLDDSYDLQDTQWPPFVGIMAVLPKNIVVRDLKITRTSCRGQPEACSNFDGLIINPGTVRNILFERVTFAGVGPNSGWWNTTSEGMTIRDCTFDNLPSDLGDAAYNFTLDRNLFRGAEQRSFNVGSAFRRYRITNNHFMLKGSACCESAIAFSSTYKPNHPGRNLVITGNTVVMANAQYGCLVGLSSVTDALVSGNTITGANTPAGDGGQCGVYIDNGTNVRVTNNMVRINGNQTTGVNINNNSGLSTNIVVEGNSLGVDHYGISITGTDTVATIGCNQIFGATTAISDGATGTVKTCAGGAGNQLGWYTSPGGSATATISNLANHQYCANFITDVDLQVGHVVIPINTADASNGLDVGIYGPDGKIIAHTSLLNLSWTGFPWPSEPLCARNPASELESCGAAGSPIGTFRIPAGRNTWCYIQGQTAFKMAAYANGAGLGGIADLGLNSGAGNCLPGADGSCSPYVLRPQVGVLAPFYSIGNYPIVILTP